MTRITFRVPGHFLATLFHVNVREYHSALWHFSSGSDRRVYPQLSYCKNVTREVLLLAPSIKENVQVTTAQEWHTNFHSVCVESTVYRPSSCSVSKHTHFLQIFPFLLQLLCTLWCSLLWAQHKHAPHLSSVVVVSIPLQGAYFASFHPSQTAFTSPPTQRRVSQNAAWVNSPSLKASSPSHGIFTSSKWKIYHSEHNYPQDTSLQLFSVHYSVNNEVNTASSHHFPHQHYWHSAIFHTLYQLLSGIITQETSWNGTVFMALCWWNCIHLTLLVKWWKKVPLMNTSPKLYLLTCFTIIFKLVLYLYTGVFSYFYHVVGSFYLSLSFTMFGIFCCCFDLAFGVIYLHSHYARQVLLLCALKRHVFSSFAFG
jgi:hypothetical protein